MLAIASSMLGYPLNWKLVTDVIELYQAPVWLIDCGQSQTSEVHRMHGTVSQQMVADYCRQRASRVQLSRLGKLGVMRSAWHMCEKKLSAFLYVGEPTEMAFSVLAGWAIARGGVSIWSTACENEFGYRLRRVKSWRARIKRAGLRAVLSGMRGIFASSRQSYLSLREVGLPTSVVCVSPFGYAHDFRNLMPSPRARADSEIVFGFIGRFVYEKGIYLLLDAIETMESARLELAGGGVDSEKFKAEIAARGLTGRVQCVGMLDPSSIGRFLQGIDCLVCPSIGVPGWREQFGLAAVEAMSAGLPVIASDSGSLPEVVGPAGIIFCEGDGEALAAAMARVTRDASLRAELGRRARARFEELFGGTTGARMIVHWLRTGQGNAESI